MVISAADFRVAGRTPLLVLSINLLFPKEDERSKPEGVAKPIKAGLDK